MAKGKYRRRRIRRQRRQTKICESGMSARVVHCLEHAGITTLREMDLCTVDDLTAIDGIGDADIREILKYRWDGAS